ncbi:hypothetical protein LJC56_00770 [Christensenellaceae bacterium OttesenSCG-928-K19]|nr:hypothetical protein [Christensenellaceae bacterium OttesenSCG-928-K19]
MKSENNTVKTTINMFQNLNPPRAHADGTRRSFALPLAIILIVVAMVSACLYFFFQGRSLDARIAVHTAALANPANTESAQTEARQYAIYSSTLSETREALERLTKFDSSILSQMESAQPSSVSITALSVSNNVVTLDCSSTSNTAPADYAAALDGLGIFASVDYSGFSGTSHENYSFTVSCTLSMMGGDAG